jgi:serine/threonine-protein kinase RsbW
MSTFTKTYTDLDRAIDEVRTLSEEWPAAQAPDGPDDETVQCVCLVLHEWIANLHQHAQFPTSLPTVELHLSFQDRQVSCSVLDNSKGFDIEAHLPSEDDEPEALPERGMGLRMIKTCTDSLSYTSTDDGLQCFEFNIPPDHDPWLNTLF